jgi:predicted dehydrogenase
VDKVVDLSADRRSFVSSLYPDIDVTKNLEDIFNDSRIQAVVIATPVKFHFELSMRALQSGKHVLVEKPMATTVQEIEQIRALTETNNLVAMVGHTFLYNPAVRAVKKIIESGELGDIRYIYSQRVNLGRIRSDVDALWNLAPHDISIVQYWLGEPTPISVKRSGMAYVQPDIEDVSFLNLKYPNNILVNIHVSWLDPRKVRRMTVVGSNKMVVYDDLADEKVIVYDKGIDRMAILGENMDFDSITNNGFNHRSGKARSVKVDWQEPLKVEVDHFAQCIQESAECLTGVSHAERVVRILQFGNEVSNTY